MNQQNQNESVTEELATFEKEKLSRRNALGRLGFLAGAAAVAALTSDELLRKVGEQLSKNAGDNAVAKQVAKEFQAAGVALASPSDELGNCTGCTACTPTYTKKCATCGTYFNNYCNGNKKLVNKTCADMGADYGMTACFDCCNDRNPGDPNGAAYCALISNCGGY